MATELTEVVVPEGARAFTDGAPRSIVVGGDRQAIATGGGPPEGVDPGGNFFSPTIVTDTSDEMEIAREEVFGPVVVAMPFKDEADVVRRANASRYGLATGVWTGDVGRAHRVAAALQARTVWVNDYNMIDPTMPFGGFKQSGFGRDLGAEALAQYTQTEAIWVRLGA